MKRYLLLVPFLAVQGPLTTVYAAFKASPAGGVKYGLLTLFILAVLVDLLTDVGAFLIGKYGKERIVGRYPKRFSISPERFRVLEEYFKVEGTKTLALAKVSHGLGWPVMIVAGSAGVTYARFVTINVITSMVKSAALMWLGYYYGRHYKQIVHALSGIALIFTSLLVIVVAYFMLSRQRRKKRG